MSPRTSTPDVHNADGSMTVRLKRACNGCGNLLGDFDGRDVDTDGNLTDVRAECPTCLPLVELERAGCQVRRLTERSIGVLWRWIENGKPFYVEDRTNTKGRADGTPRGLKVDGLSVYNPDATDYADRRHVARFGDWIIRHPDGRWSTRRQTTGAES